MPASVRFFESLTENFGAEKIMEIAEAAAVWLHNKKNPICRCSCPATMEKAWAKDGKIVFCTDCYWADYADQKSGGGLKYDEKPTAEMATQSEPSSDESQGSLSSKKKAKRDFGNLKEVMVIGTPVFVETSGERWDGVFTGEGFLVDGKIYKSPTALCKAHASRITEAHPNPTKPGSGWVFVRLASNKKSIGEMFDAYFGLV